MSCGSGAHDTRCGRKSPSFDLPASVKWTVIQGVLLGGLVMLAGMFLFGVFFLKNLATQYYLWWWVIHLWAEGAWELVAGSIMAFVLMTITGVEREQVEKWP